MLSEHGGNIYRFMEEMSYEIDGVIDFSASINPLGVPESVIEKIKDGIKFLCHYPDPEAKRLTQEISRHLEINPQYIICGNGSTELIYLIVRALRPERVLIPEPTFSEYERACRLCNKLEVVSYELKEENNFRIDPDDFISSLITHHLSRSLDMVFLCNPNNPTGQLLKRDDVIKIADAARDLKCYLVVDEAFIDFIPEDSVINEVENNPYLVVLRSLTKFYALSGLRIGYGVFPEDVINLIRRHKEPWTVNTLAEMAGIAALKDIGYKKETFKVIGEGKKLLEDGFRLLRINYFPSSANFYLIRHGKARKIISSLNDKRIMVRDCSNFRGLDSTYMRIAVRSKGDNMILLKEFGEICQAL
ncbi:MAG: threonine-phosphate decarboxylase CobD [Thermodesulfovibrionales bacterium]